MLQAAPEQDRGRLLHLLVAILVGLAAGFGWGYWTAWRTMDRQAVAIEGLTPGSGEQMVAGGTSPTPASPAPPGAAPDGPRQVDEPEVIGEGGLPPAADTRRSAPPPASPAPPAESRDSAPARSTAPPPAPEPASGRILVRSTPAGARILVDGRPRGTTPAALRGLPFGTVTLTVEHDGYRSEIRRVSLSEARPSATLTVPLTPAGSAAAARPGAAGALVVESRPSGARVIVDGQSIGATPLSLPEVTSGRHAVRLELNGFQPWSTWVEVTPGERTRVAASLEMISPQ